MGVTHNDSRDQTRQLRFSSRGPSSSVSEHLEKIDHIAMRLLALEGSMWCILPRSRDSTGGAFKREGIFAGVLIEQPEAKEVDIESAPKCVPGWDM